MFDYMNTQRVFYIYKGPKFSSTEIAMFLQ